MRTSFGWKGKGKYGSFIPFVDKRVGGKVKLCDLLTTSAIPERFCDEIVSQKTLPGISSVLHLYLYSKSERVWQCVCCLAYFVYCILTLYS